MDPHLHYDFRDILIAPARALSAKRIFVMTLFLCSGLIVYDLFTYAAVALDGEKVGTFWKIYGLAPVTLFLFDHVVARIVYALGAALGIFAVMLGFFAVAAIEMEQVRGNRFLSIGGAILFTLKRFTQMALSELAIIAFMALIVVLFLLLGLITRIPFIGEYIYALTFLVPAFIIAIFTVFIFAVFQVSVVLLPVTAAAERNGEAFTAILETFSTVVRQPVRWLLYTAYGLAAAKVCSFVYAYFCYRAVQFVGWAVSISGGDKADALIRGGLSHLPLRSDLVRETLSIFPGINFSFSIAHWVRPMSGDPAGHVMALMLFLIFASIIGYALASLATAQARGYVVIRYLKDEYRIADEQPLFLEAEENEGTAATNDQSEQPLN